MATIREVTEHGSRVGALCVAAAAQAKAETATMFDLGEPDPAALRRLDGKRGRR